MRLASAWLLARTVGGVERGRGVLGELLDQEVEELADVGLVGVQQLVVAQLALEVQFLDGQSVWQGEKHKIKVEIKLLTLMALASSVPTLTFCDMPRGKVFGHFLPAQE